MRGRAVCIEYDFHRRILFADKSSDTFKKTSTTVLRRVDELFVLIERESPIKTPTAASKRNIYNTDKKDFTNKMFSLEHCNTSQNDCCDKQYFNIE